MIKNKAQHPGNEKTYQKKFRELDKIKQEKNMENFKQGLTRIYQSHEDKKDFISFQYS